MLTSWNKAGCLYFQDWELEGYLKIELSAGTMPCLMTTSDSMKVVVVVH
jgi:hypothetical protein